MQTVQQEINRLYLESKMNRYIVSNEASLYYDLCSVVDKTITLDEFYKLYPQYDVEKTESLYWKQFMQQWKETWKQETI